MNVKPMTELTDEDKIRMFEAFRHDEISEDEARELLGEEFDLMQADIREFASAVSELATSEYIE